MADQERHGPVLHQERQDHGGRRDDASHDLQLLVDRRLAGGDRPDVGEAGGDHLLERRHRGARQPEGVDALDLETLLVADRPLAAQADLVDREERRVRRSTARGAQEEPEDLGPVLGLLQLGSRLPGVERT